MALPAQVQAALDAADATLAEVNAQASSTPETNSLTDPEPSPSVPEPQAQPQAPVQAEPPPPPTAKPHDEWEARYKSLQGLFNQQVPALQSQVKELQGSLADAVTRLNQASAQKEQEPAQAQAASPKDVENFGSDLVDFVNRVAGDSLSRTTQAMEAKAKALEAKIVQLTEQLSGTSQAVAQTAEQGFFDKLAKQVPSWEQVNADPRFLAWVAESDPVYGIPRQQALTGAQQRLDADRAAAVFKAFLGPQSQAPKPDPLDSMVSPKGAATTAPEPAQRPVFTQAQVTKFYDDVNKGRYRGNEAEVTRVEALINAALSEGRIR